MSSTIRARLLMLVLVLLGVTLLLSGDLGRSVSLDRPVADVVLSALGPTLLLVGSALAAGSLIGLSAGLSAARHQRRIGDRLLRLLILLGISTPSLLPGLLLVLVFAVWPGWFPVSGLHSAFGDGGPWDLLSHLLLPVLSLALAAGAVIARTTRSAAVEIMQQDPIRMARARGIGERRLHRVHVLKGVLGRLVLEVGWLAGFLIGGALYIETIFQWPGLGRLLVEAVGVRDIPLIQGVILVLTVLYLLVRLLADLVHRWLDPRVRDA